MRDGRVERIRRVALLVLVALPGTCSAPATTAKLGADVELRSLMQRVAELRSCTATYLVHGADEQTIRFTYLAPDQLRFETRGANFVGSRVVWILGNRTVLRSEDESGEFAADCVMMSPHSIAAIEAVEVALRDAFPSPASPDGEFELRDYGPGVFVHFWVEPDRDAPEHGKFDISAGWVPSRRYIFDWLGRMSAMPVLRDEGNLIVAEDPAPRMVVAVSKANGFIESVTMAGWRCVELAEWKESVDASEFTIPDPVPGARDLSDTFPQMFEALGAATVEADIELAVRNARKRESIPDKELQKRLAPVYAAALRELLQELLTRVREGASKVAEDSITMIERMHTASAADPDLRGQFDSSVTRIRDGYVKSLQKGADELCAIEPPHIDGDAEVIALMALMRRQAIRDLYKHEIKQPALARFDEQVAAIRSKK